LRRGPIYAAVKNRKITLFAVALLIISGLYSYYISPRQESPDINAPIALITTVYPGASPEDVEKQVTSKIENKVVEIDGYDSVDSTSKDSVSTVVLKLDQGVDVDKAWSELRQKMDDLQPDLPEECQDVEINTDLTETAGMIISIAGKNYGYDELESYAEDLKDLLGNVDGVSRFDITGKQDKQVSVSVDISKLNSYSLSLEDIVRIITAQNVEIPSGKISDGNSKINVKIPGNYTSLDELKNTILMVSPSNGSAVRLRDVADVGMAPEDSSYKIKQNGENAVLLTGYFKSNKNVVLVGKDVEKALTAFKARLPKDVTFDEVIYQPKDVSSSVNGFIMNLLEGMLFVMIVVFIGMGARNAVVVSTAIPLSVLITFSAMNLLGIKIHQISITALIIALGMLVDNAVVVSDAIQVRMDNGEEKMDACVDGVKEVALPVLTSTLTTVGAFLPLLMLPSLAGEYVKSLPQIIIISLMASYLVALFVTPTMAFMLFRKGKAAEKPSKLRNFFSVSLQYALNHKRSIILLSLAALGFSIFLGTRLGLQFFPKADKNIIYVDITGEHRGDIARTEALADEVAGILKEQKEIVSLTEAIGNGLPKFYTTMALYTPSQDFAQIMCRLDLKKGGRFKNNTQFLDYVQEVLDSGITGGRATVKQLEQGEPIGNPIRIRIYGDSMEMLKDSADQVENALRDIEGTINVDDDCSDSIYEYYADVDADKASTMGISKYDMQNEVNIALSGRQASVYKKGGNDYDIVVKGNIESVEDLENIAIKSSVTGNKVLLKDIAQITLESHVPSIKKHDRKKSIMVVSDVKDGYNPVNIEKELKGKLDKMDLGGVNIAFDGENSKIVLYFGDMGSSAVFALLLIFGVLLLEFGSFSQVLLILLTIPLSVIGSLTGLFISRQPLSFTSMMGIVSLMGIVVNNAIVLIDYINVERRNGVKIEDACAQAAGRRLRPIMLTTTTTVVGLIPLVLAGDSMFTPMSISLLSGLMVSTLLTLILIPTVYALVEGRKEKIYKNITLRAQGR